MATNQEPSENTLKDDDESDTLNPTCIHHWIIESETHAGYNRGVCIKCDAKKQFNSSGTASNKTPSAYRVAR